MDVREFTHSFSREIEQYINCDPQIKRRNDHYHGIHAYNVNAIEFGTNNSILVNIGNTFYQTKVKNSLKLEKLDHYDLNNVEKLLPVRFNNCNRFELLYYNVFDKNDNKITFVLEENDTCINLGELFVDKHLSNPCYSIRHNSIFQIASVDNESMLIQTKLGQSLYETDSNCIILPSIYNWCCICPIPYQDYILVAQNNRLDWLDLSGQIIKSFNVNHVQSIEYLCCTETMIIIIGVYTYKLRGIDEYLALFYDLETLEYIGKYEIDYSSEWHEKYFINYSFNYSYGHDSAILCSINPDKMIIFSNKQNCSKEDVACIQVYTPLYKDLSQLVCDYVGGLL
jgi:hypothetical protein